MKHHKFLIGLLSFLLTFPLQCLANCPPVETDLFSISRIIRDFEKQGCTDLRVTLQENGRWLVREQVNIMPSSVNVSGGGSSFLNGVYTYRGEYNSRPYYNLVGQPDSTDDYAIAWFFGEWWIGGNNGTFYLSGEDVAYPWLVSSWDIDAGDSPAPTVTELPASALPLPFRTHQAVQRASFY